MQTTIDIRVQNHGSVVLLVPESDAAREWLTDNCNTEPWQWFRGGLAIERCYADNIIEAAQCDGLEVM